MWTYSFRLSGLESHVKVQRRKTPRHALDPLQLIAIASTQFGIFLTVGIMAAVVCVVLPSQQVRITSVTAPDGQNMTSVTHEQSVLVNGRVTNPRISRIFLDVNGALRPVSVEAGSAGASRRGNRRMVNSDTIPNLSAARRLAFPRVCE
jgi:hypothetical protein